MALAVLIFSEGFGNIMMVEKWIGGVFFLGFSSLNFSKDRKLNWNLEGRTKCLYTISSNRISLLLKNFDEAKDTD